MTIPFLSDIPLPLLFPVLLFCVFVMDTAAGAYRAKIEGTFNWKQLLLAGWKCLVYSLIAVVSHLGQMEGLLMFVVGREFNSFLQNIGRINDHLDIEDGDIFYTISDWYNLNQRSTEK